MRHPDSSWRLFIAIDLPVPLRRRVQVHINQLNEVSEAKASWTSEDNLHLTLKFFGDTPVNKIEAITEAMASAASHLAPFEVEIGGCGAFPTGGQPRVLWIGLKDLTDTLDSLYRAIEDECAKANFPREVRAFHPHLTIARLRQPRGARSLAELHKATGFNSARVNVRDLCLMRSELSSAGSRYTVIARQSLDR